MRLTPFLLVLFFLAGCQSSRQADRLGVAGGLLGAGLGAVIGHQSGDAATGALLGAGVGAMGGAVVGDALDVQAAQNRVAIAGQLGRQVTPGSATIDEIISMHRAGVDPQLIQGYINTSGVAVPPSPNDLIALQQQGVPTGIIQTMQTVATQSPQGLSPSQTVIVQEPMYPPPIYVGPPGWHHGHHGYHSYPRRVGWGVSVGL